MSSISYENAASVVGKTESWPMPKQLPHTFKIPYNNLFLLENFVF